MSTEPDWDTDPTINPYLDDVNPLAAERDAREALRPQRAKRDPQDRSELRLIELQTENVLCLKAVTLRPQSAMTVIGGQNGAGKSTVLNSIIMALAGGRKIPELPVRLGEDEAFIRLDLGKIIVERTIEAGGKTSLRVTTPEGAQFSSPQAMLNEIIPEFDPLAFARAVPKEQANRLCKLLGLDFTDLDGRRLKLYTERTDLGRDLARSEGALKTMPHHPDAPKVSVSVAKLTEELNAAHEHNRNNLQLRRQADDAWAIVAEQKQRREELAARISELNRQLTALDISMVGNKDAAEKADNAVEATPPDRDTAPLSAAIAEAETTNRQVRENAARGAHAAAVNELRRESSALTKQIEAIDAEKARLIADAPFPVPDLGFDEQGGVTLNGFPFATASSAQQLRASAALGFASAPRLNLMLIHNGSLLDDTQLAVIEGLAQEYGAQVLVERVSSDGTGCTIYIEDGEVRDASEGGE